MRSITLYLGPKKARHAILMPYLWFHAKWFSFKTRLKETLMQCRRADVSRGLVVTEKYRIQCNVICTQFICNYSNLKNKNKQIQFLEFHDIYFVWKTCPFLQTYFQKTENNFDEWRLWTEISSNFILFASDKFCTYNSATFVC